MAPRRNDDGFRTAMLEAAAALIAERGYHAVRIADIAEACDASTGSVHYHFSGKDDVLTAALRFAIERAFARNRDALRGVDDARERLVRLIELQLPAGPDLRGEWAVWLEYWTESARRPELQELHRELYAGWRHLIADTVRRGQRQGVFRAGDADALAETLHGADRRCRRARDDGLARGGGGGGRPADAGAPRRLRGRARRRRSGAHLIAPTLSALVVRLSVGKRPATWCDACGRSVHQARDRRSRPRVRWGRQRSGSVP